MTALYFSTLMTIIAQPPVADAPGSPAPIDTSFLRLYAETKGFMLGRPAKPKFSPDGKTVFFLRSEAKNPKQSLYAFDVESKQTKPLLTPEMLLGGKDEQLSDEEKARRERQRITAGGFADYHLSPDGTKILVSLSGRLFVFDRTTTKHAELKTGPGSCIDPKWSPDGKLIGYVRGYDIYAFDLAAGTESAVTTGGTSVKTNGLAEFVAQEEMHRHSGYWWSPDSKQIAFCEADHTGVEQWAVADPLNPDKLGAPQYYPRPGKKNVSVRLGIATLGSEKVVWVEWEWRQREYLADVKWEPNEKCIYALIQNRNQSELAFVTIEPLTGKTVEFHREKDAAWVNIPDGLPRFDIAAGGKLWLSESSGRIEFLHFDKDKQLVQAIAIPNQLLLNINNINYDSGTTTVYGYATNSPTEQHVWRIYTTSGYWGPASDAKQLTEEPGIHTAVKSPSNIFNSRGAIAITSTSLKSLPATHLRHTDQGQPYADLPSVATEPAFKPSVTVEKVGDYYTAIVKPNDFDPTKKYPVIVDVYGGPRHLHVVQAMRNWLIPQWLADQGFIVVAIDNRGTPGRGREWERAIYQKFGTVPLEDQAKGLQALGAKHPQMDLGRVGIVGWSFGGYMAANAVLRRPDVFHAAVAGAPVTDWEDYDTHYTERYLGVLPESRKAYDEASLIPLAKDLKRPLLLIHGTADDNVYYRHTLKLSDAIFRAGKTCEVLPLPGVTHMYSADPQVAERMWERTVRFFKRELGGVK